MTLLSFNSLLLLEIWVHVTFKGLELRQHPQPLLLAPLTAKGRSQLFLFAKHWVGLTTFAGVPPLHFHLTLETQHKECLSAFTGN